jgi:hypothetical protein
VRVAIREVEVHAAHKQVPLHSAERSFNAAALQDPIAPQFADKRQPQLQCSQPALPRMGPKASR